MGKENIVNDYWICRTIMGTIALEEEKSIKTRNFLYQIVTPKKLSDIFRVLNKSMPMDFYDLADFYNELNHCMSQLWVEKVDEPQVIKDAPIVNVDDIDLPDSWGIFAVTQSIKDKSKSGTDSDLSETLFDDFGNPKATANDLKYWLEQEKEEQKELGQNEKVEFKPQKEDVTFNYSITETFSFKEDNGVEEIPELPEDNPFFREGNISTNLGHEFEIPINDETKKMLEIFDQTTISDFKKDFEKKNDEFFPSNLQTENLMDASILEVGIGKSIETLEPKKINGSSNNSTKSNIQNKKTRNSKKIIKKKTFIDKILSMFKK